MTDRKTRYVNYGNSEKGKREKSKDEEGMKGKGGN